MLNKTFTAALEKSAKPGVDLCRLAGLGKVFRDVTRRQHT